MELHGLAMVILGPPVDGAEVISYARPEECIRRELFLVGGRPVGGALIGDISAAGTLHALINAGRRDQHRGSRTSQAAERKASSRSPNNAGRRQALILSPKRSNL